MELIDHTLAVSFLSTFNLISVIVWPTINEKQRPFHGSILSFPTLHSSLHPLTAILLHTKKVSWLDPEAIASLGNA